MKRLVLLVLLAAALTTAGARRTQAQQPSVGVGSSPCTDPLYTALLRRPVDSLSEREYELFLERDRACVDWRIARQVAQQAGRKDAVTATLFGTLMLGGGQFYAGEPGRGGLLLLGATGAVAAGYLLTSPGCRTLAVSPPIGCGTRRIPLLAGLFMATGVWMYGAGDADDAAARANARERERSARPGRPHAIDVELSLAADPAAGAVAVWGRLRR